MEQLFLDIWSRQWCRINGSRTQASEADFFQAYVRVPASAVQHLVWLPGQTSAQAQHALRRMERAVALARIGNKYGLRTKEADEQAVFEALRPQHQFMEIRVLAHYRLHPLPHGLQRPTLVQLLKQWNWNCNQEGPTGFIWLTGLIN